MLDSFESKKIKRITKILKDAEKMDYINPMVLNTIKREILDIVDKRSYNGGMVNHWRWDNGVSELYEWLKEA